MTLDDFWMTQNAPKRAKKYNCDICDYKCYKISDLERHKTTLKHKQNDQELLLDDPKRAKRATPEYDYKCDCGKTYKYKQGLWKHKQNCNYDNSNNKSDLIMLLIKENTELKQMVMEIVKNGTTNNNCNNTNNINTTNNNNHFNLNLFLNETCKNAMNINEFVDQIQVKLSDLENTGRLGYAEGISRIFIKGLKDLEVNERPIHCSDGKRETLYIKEGDKWEKDDSNKSKLENAIRKVGHKNIRMIPEWKKKYPDCEDYYSKKNNLYLNIVGNSMCGGTEEETETNYSKIKKNIIKEVIIDK
jgi:hypothetical protein